MASARIMSNVTSTKQYQLTRNHACKFWIKEARDPSCAKTLVLVHGISRNAIHMLRSFSKLAQEHNYTLIIPYFDRVNYPDYQRLGRHGRGLRADLALNKILDIFFAGDKQKVHLFGFSGGAQFSHRYALAHHTRVMSFSVAAAGWYTNINSQASFPYGYGHCNSLADLEFDCNAFLECPSYTLVGDRDNSCKKNLRSSRKVIQTQGETRLVRAKWFHQSVKELSESKGISCIHKMDLLQNTSHEFGQGDVRSDLVAKVLSFCNSAHGK